MTNDASERKLLELFSQSDCIYNNKNDNYLIENVCENCLTLHETEDGGKNEVTFINGRFIQFSHDMLCKLNVSIFLNEKEKDILSKKCDGIFLINANNRMILCLAELKVKINRYFPKVIKQIEGSYIKAALLMSLLFNIQDVELAVFIVGKLEKITDDPDIDYLELIGEITENPQNIESKLKDLSRNRKVKMSFPFYLNDSIHEYYRKKDINVYHLESEEVFDINRIWAS